MRKLCKEKNPLESTADNIKQVKMMKKQFGIHDRSKIKRTCATIKLTYNKKNSDRE